MILPLAVQAHIRVTMSPCPLFVSSPGQHSRLGSESSCASHHALRSHARPSALVCQSDLHRSCRSFRTDSLASPVPTLSSLRTRMPSWGLNDITSATLHCDVMPTLATCTPRGCMRIVWVRSVLGRWVRCERNPFHPPSLPSPPISGQPPLCSVGCSAWACPVCTHASVCVSLESEQKNEACERRGGGGGGEGLSHMHCHSSPLGLPFRPSDQQPARIPLAMGSQR